jgi:hypothetical protein
MYTLTLTEQDISDLCFVGNRYCYSDVILDFCNEGENVLSETDATAIVKAIEDDMDGGHDAFPLLYKGSLLAGKLADLYCAYTGDK